MPRFRLLHASDLHFARREQLLGILDRYYVDGTRAAARQLLSGMAAGAVQMTSSHNQAAATALARFASHNRANIDAVILSGDLATTGAASDLAAALHFVTGTDPTGVFQGTGAGTLASSGLGVHIIPGNHDRFGPPWQHMPGNAQFDADFNAAWGSPAWVTALRVISRGEVDLVLIGLDLTLAANDPVGATPARYGWGRAPKKRVDDAVALTEKYREANPKAVILWVMHFEPEAASFTLRLLEDNTTLAAGVETARPDAILCGHTHICDDKTFVGVRTLVCGTSTQYYAPSGNWICLLDITASGTFPPTFSPRWLQFDSIARTFR